MSTHVVDFLVETTRIASRTDAATLNLMVDELAALRGTLYLAGLGGSAANCSHAAADFRRLCGIDARALTDNMPELTARANDEGWKTIFSGALSKWARPGDALMVLSVGGGMPGVSEPLIEAVSVAKQIGMRVFGIVGRDGGYTLEHGDRVIVIPTIVQERVTPHTEAWQMVILHLLVSHPKLQKSATKW